MIYSKEETKKREDNRRHKEKLKKVKWRWAFNHVKCCNCEREVQWEHVYMSSTSYGNSPTIKFLCQECCKSKEEAVKIFNL